MKLLSTRNFTQILCSLINFTRSICLLTLFSLVLYLDVNGTNYYVDFETGSDNNSGYSPTLAWKHGPGDSLAIANPKNVQLNQGDTIFFKGGVRYPSTFNPSVPKGNGSSVSPIVYKGDGWPGLGDQKAVIDGSEIISGWKKCQSAAECFNNPHWKQIYYASLTEYVDVLSSNLHLNDIALTLTQYPDPNNPYEMNVVLDNWNTVTSTNVSDSTLFDEKTQDVNKHYLDGYIGVHCYSSNVEIKKITKTSNDTIYFDQLTNGPSHNITKYSVINSSDSITFDQVGEYFIKNDTSSGNQTVYTIMPNNFNPEKDTVTYSKRGCIYIGNRNHIIIEGFLIKKLMEQAIQTSSNNGNSGCRVIYNTIENIRSKDGSNLINIRNDDAIIKGNVIRNIGNMRGIITTGCNILIADNHLDNIGGTAIFANRCKNVRIIGNKVSNSIGSHSNGISTYNDTSVLVANNIILNTARPYTFENSKDVTVFQNILYNDLDVYVCAQWGKGTVGTVKLLNNIIVGGKTNFALLLAFDNPAKVYSVNNIIGGGGWDDELIDTNRYVRRNNVYTKLAWVQNSKYDWKLGTGEKIGGNLSILFSSVDKLDFMHPRGGIGINSGINPMAILAGDTLIYENDFVFRRDIFGNRRPTDAVWDIGPYECVENCESVRLKKPNSLQIEMK